MSGEQTLFVIRICHKMLSVNDCEKRTLLQPALRHLDTCRKDGYSKCSFLVRWHPSRKSCLWLLIFWTSKSWAIRVDKSLPFEDYKHQCCSCLCVILCQSISSGSWLSTWYIRNRTTEEAGSRSTTPNLASPLSRYYGIEGLVGGNSKYFVEEVGGPGQPHTLPKIIWMSKWPFWDLKRLHNKQTKRSSSFFRWFVDPPNHCSLSKSHLEIGAKLKFSICLGEDSQSLLLSFYITLPETNIATENTYFQKDIHFPTIDFPGRNSC